MPGVNIPERIQGRVTGAAQGEALGTALREQQQRPTGETSGKRAAAAPAGDAASGPESPTAD